VGAAYRVVIGRLPNGPGVYRFRDARGRVLYLGRASDLRQRVGSYWRDLGERRHLGRMVAQVARIEAVACDSVHEAAWLERNLLEGAKPRWNRTRGTESAMCVRLDGGEGARLVVLHWPFAEPAGAASFGGALFGPYLGGTQTRLAVSALDRVLPLRYTDDRLSGCARDLARARGVAPANREQLLHAVAAVLDGRPASVATVRQELVRHRDRAAERLAYELAARIQQEIEAIEWVVAEQKVTRMSVAGASAPADYAVYGWANEMLLRLRIRSGRLCAWDQRACSRLDARGYLDRTPAEWRTFATRNAELASQLANAHAAA
jgi:excinuclease ABC subunit C